MGFIFCTKTRILNKSCDGVWCIFVFPQTEDGKINRNKSRRNSKQKCFCGWVSACVKMRTKYPPATSPNESLRAVVQCAAAAVCMISKTSFTFDSLCINNQKNALTSSATNLFTCYNVTLANRIMFRTMLFKRNWSVTLWFPYTQYPANKMMTSLSQI